MQFLLMVVGNLAAYLKGKTASVLMKAMSVMLNEGQCGGVTSVGFVDVNGRKGRKKMRLKVGTKKRRIRRRKRRNRWWRMRWKGRGGWRRDGMKMTGVFCAFLRERRYIIYTHTIL